MALTVRPTARPEPFSVWTNSGFALGSRRNRALGGAPRQAGAAEDHHLDLVELVLADEAADVLPVRPGFAPETGRVGDEAYRQDRTVEDLVAVDVRQRHLRGRDEVPVEAFELEQV